MAKLTLAEMETTIRFDREGDMAYIYTADPVMMRKLARLSRENGALAMNYQDEIGCWYQCPKSWIKVQRPRRVSQETKERLARYGRGE